MNNSVEFNIKAREVLEHEKPTGDGEKTPKEEKPKRKALLWGEWNTEFVVVLTKKKKGDENWQCVYVFLFLHFFSFRCHVELLAHDSDSNVPAISQHRQQLEPLCSELHFSLGLIKVARRHIFTFHTPFVHVLEFFLHLVVVSGENLQVAARSSAREVF